MKKTYLSFLTAFLVIIIFTYQTNAQITIQVGGGVGYSVPSGDFGGDPVDFYNGTKYGMNPGFNVHGKARVGFLFLNVFGEIGYTSFSNDGGIDPANNNKTVDVSTKVFSVKLGPEFKLNIPMSPITPYLDAFVALNSFSGTVEYKGVPDLPSSEQDINSATRIGLGAGGGVLFKLGGINLDLSVQYNLMNIAGKDFEGTKDNRLDSYIYLNDDKDPLYTVNDDKHILSDSRSISALEFKLTVMFGL
ncbi:MAG: outer membrane beta-barrel protein [Ignavibacteriaceae bacterium]